MTIIRLLDACQNPPPEARMLVFVDPAEVGTKVNDARLQAQIVRSHQAHMLVTRRSQSAISISVQVSV